LRDGRAILLDFDIARRVGERGSGRKPRGSPPFMAPEQVRCEPAAPSMDIFALGAVLYEAATGEPAFAPSGESAERVYPQLDAAPPPPTTLAPSVSPATGNAIERLLALDPRDRPASASAALALLAAALAPGEEGLWPEWAGPLLSEPQEVTAWSS
jgi:serine/threonine protein kinase